jgi:hypothetical protein
MRISEIIRENASAGATASGNIATVANPAVANPNRGKKSYIGDPRTGMSGTKSPPQYKAKKQKPSDNALNKSNSLFGAGTIKRNTSNSLASLDASKITTG